jgi:hypothetical protein
MSDWFYQIVNDLNTYDKQQEMKELYNRMYLAKDPRKELKVWCEEMLDLANIPHGSFRDAFIKELFKGNSDEPQHLLRHIWDMCGDEDEESEAEDF